MAVESDPGVWSKIAEHMPWIATIGTAIAGLWASVIGSVWKRQANKVEGNAEAIRSLEERKADNDRVNRLETWLREDVGEIHRKLDELRIQGQR